MKFKVYSLPKEQTFNLEPFQKLGGFFSKICHIWFCANKHSQLHSTSVNSMAKYLKHLNEF